ncbi:hypothetical protein VP01_148g25 [Puccinia sorghi]|uniref:Uncharacterized protein n=1 Tax=Puccinia sorghi TaxID=27349 RepID=A0A0L6VJF8_9BASI|nr:hypothetical protein VP01_148g25 [Puccinia sorghi]
MEATKAAKEMVKVNKHSALAVSRFTWTEEASLELVGFVKMVKEKHTEKS